MYLCYIYVHSNLLWHAYSNMHAVGTQNMQVCEYVLLEKEAAVDGGIVMTIDFM